MDSLPQASSPEGEPTTHLTPTSAMSLECIALGRGGQVPLTPESFRLLRTWGCDAYDLGCYAFSIGMRRSERRALLKVIPQEDRDSFTAGYEDGRAHKERRGLSMDTRVLTLTIESLGSSRSAKRVRAVFDGVRGNGGNIRLDDHAVEQLARDLVDLTAPLSWLHSELRTCGSTDNQALYLVHRLRRFWYPVSTLTDLSNARRFCLFFGNDVRYCRGMGWYVWDGRRWRKDDLGQVEHRAKGLADVWRADADIVSRTLLFAKDHDEVEAIIWSTNGLYGRALGYESLPMLTRMLKILETEPGIAVSVDELDAHPWLLNANNGTIDLRNGEFHPHRREDLITTLTPVPFRPEARFAVWDSFLDKVTGGDTELRSFMQRKAGYCASGATSEEKFFYVHGPGGSGKSTYVEAQRTALGEYGATADFETFLKRPSGGGPRNDIARLHGKRLVVSIEVDEGRELAQGLVKTITGGDTISARLLYKEYFEFKPRFKLVLVANNDPGVDADDDAMWRRLVAVPLTQAVPEDERQPLIKAVLTNPYLGGPAVLFWIVEGAMRYQAEGLGTAPAVQGATKAYRDSVDVVGAFIDEVCTVGSGLMVSVSQLYSSYHLWALENGELPVLTGNLFGRRLTQKGFEPGKVNGQRVRLGIRISRWRLAALAYGDPNPALPAGTA